MNVKFRLTLCSAALLTLSVGNLEAGVLAYTLVSDGVLGTTDLNTGAFSLIANNNLFYAGLGVANGTLYGVSNAGSVLWSINPANGSASAVGFDPTADYRYFGSTTSGLYAIGYEPGTGWGVLLSINPSNGAATLIGPTGLGNVTGYGNLSTNSSTLYFAEGGMLYTIDTTTGAATQVGYMGGAQIQGMISEGGVLYGAEYSPDFQLDTLNTTNGSATAGASLSAIVKYGTVVGLAPDPLTPPPPSSVPEPSTMVLLGVGGAVLFALRKRFGYNRGIQISHR